MLLLTKTTIDIMSFDSFSNPFFKATRVGSVDQVQCLGIPLYVKRNDMKLFLGMMVLAVAASFSFGASFVRSLMNLRASWNSGEAKAKCNDTFVYPYTNKL